MIETGQGHENPWGADVDGEDNDEDSSLESIRDDGFEDDILTLRNHFFISANADKTTFEMHGLKHVGTSLQIYIGL